MFNLDHAISEWRQHMIAAGIKSSAALDELESHLRDDVEQQARSGLGEAQAFEIAVPRIGPAGALKKEFKKIGHPNRELLRKLKDMLFGITEVPFPALDDFAPSARQTLAAAPEEARRFHHDFVGTEHVLLGLAQSRSGIVAGVMRQLGINSDSVRDEIEKIVGAGAAPGAAAKIPFTPRARRALQLAVSEAKALNHSEAGAEHIFLGLLLEGSGVAALVLKSLGVETERTRDAILKEPGLSNGGATTGS